MLSVLYLVNVRNVEVKENVSKIKSDDCGRGGVCLECGGVSLVMVIVTKGSKGGTLEGGRMGGGYGGGGQLSGNFWSLLLIFFLEIDKP